MNDKKINPALNMSLPKLQDQKTDVVNGKQRSKYTPVFIIQAVYCQNCKSTAAPNGLAYVSDYQALEILAESMHSQVVVMKRLLCAESKLIFSYTNGFINV